MFSLAVIGTAVKVNCVRCVSQGLVCCIQQSVKMSGLLSRQSHPQSIFLLWAGVPCDVIACLSG